MYKIGWFSTGRGEGSKGLLREMQSSIESGKVQAKLEFVFCSREYGETEATDQYLKMVEDYNIPLVCFSYQKYRRSRGELTPKTPGTMPQWRLDYDREVMARLKNFQPDLSVLAGFMLIFGEEMCNRYDIINLHPAAPGGPAGMWQDVIWELIERNASEHGVKMHLVIPELDVGPTVSYCTFPIKGEHFDKYWRELDQQSVEYVRKTQGEDNLLFNKIRQYGVARETPLTVATIKAFSEGRVKIAADKRVIDAGGKDIEGYDLTGEIEDEIKTG